MRGVLVLALVSACSFEHGVLSSDASSPPPDMRPDVIVPTWMVDGTSKKGVPAAVFEWSELGRLNGLTTPPPEHLWLMQETAGSLVDSIGTTPLTPLNTPTYANVVAGWSRAGVGTDDTVANEGFLTNALGNLNGTSYLLLVYVAVVTTPSSERQLCGIGAGSDHRYVAITPTAVFKGTGTGVVPTTGTVNPMTAVHPVIVKIHPSSMSFVVYTDQEKLAMTWAATGGTAGLLMVGNATIGAAAAQYVYGALWTGASADQSDADVKKLLQSLGWTVTGY